MTYCVAVSVDAGMVFCSDSLTNAGIDQVSTYSKMFRFGLDGEKQFVILTAGNLATSQATIGKIKNDIKAHAQENLLNMRSVEDAADYIGNISREQQDKHTVEGKKFEASFIVGGQIGDAQHEIILVYPEGNHITTSGDTPYLQIGESKYGKPILDRILTPDLNLDTCAMCALVSMDSTLRSNLSVGPPIEALIYKTNSLVLDTPHRFDADSDFLRDLKRSWDQRLKDAFRQMPPISWAANWDKSGRERSGAS
ncbi:MAG: peptidase [Gammaproteobacteria bacterium]|jgi:putative proteasome-type protease|nr:peptidase [Gammaproteobacteria bacterium]HJN95126.1 peptidase [Gammaproteobacteria bacterium]|tara:strand:- start:46551 stop:47309 length:759 start_codon:yes stop_codon:yes gene_type:complete